MAVRVVFPTCRPQQAAMSGDWSRRNSSWYGKGLKFRKFRAKVIGSLMESATYWAYFLKSSFRSIFERL